MCLHLVMAMFHWVEFGPHTFDPQGGRFAAKWTTIPPDACLLNVSLLFHATWAALLDFVGMILDRLWGTSIHNNNMAGQSPLLIIQLR